jgi:TRAP transporter TAXI family solute receptor
MPLRSITSTVHRWVAILMIATIGCSVAAWYLTLDPVPKLVRLATAEPGGLYHSLGEGLANSFQEERDSTLQLVTTRGSVENRDKLISGAVHFAIIQGGSIPLSSLSIIAPLYPDIIHVIVRQELEINDIQDLVNLRLIVGKEGSGTRVSAMTILRHYRLEDKIHFIEDLYFGDLIDSSQEAPLADGAIITTGILNPDLKALLATGDYKLVEISDSEALEMVDPFLVQFRIPRGLYGENPAIPPSSIKTVSTMALLAARDGVSPALVGAMLEALHKQDMRLEFPNLIAKGNALLHSPAPLHESAQSFFQPRDHLGLLTNVMESLAAIKELLFALAAGLWLLWDRWEGIKKKEVEKMIQRQKDHLDEYLDRTLKIEERQITTTDPDDLKEYLDQVTQIKLDALKRLTHEELRSDQAFTIFITQCANLINKIQFKIINHANQNVRKSRRAPKGIPPAM